MSLPPPPSPEFSDIPPPAGGDLPPGVPEAGRHEADVLKRRTHFSWKKFGGEGFLVSVAVHTLLLIAGLLWVINEWRGQAPKPPEFTTGGSGNNGARITQTKSATKPPPMIVKMPSIIVTKNVNASVTMPGTPAPGAPSFAKGLAGGDASKGSGGNFGGGAGLAPGPGKGDRPATSFGYRPLRWDGGLVGTYYDTKYKRPSNPADKLEPSDVWQTPPTWHSPDNASYAACFPDKPERNLTLDADRYYKLLNEVAQSDSERALSKYFVSPTKLFTTRLWIPSSPSATSPQAFEVADKCKGHFWCVVYRARISPPSSGRWRFVGAGDDMLAVKVAGKNVLGWFWWLDKSYLKQNWLGAPKRPGAPVDTNKLRHYRGATGYGRPGGAGVGDWVQMDKGKFYDFEVVIGDWGGAFRGFLLCEKEGEKYEAVPSTVGGKTEPKLYLFRTAEENPAPGAAGLPVDYVTDSPVWLARQPKAASIR